MTYNGYKLPKITTTISETIRIADLKATKERMKELKYNLEDMLISRLEITEEELAIRYHRVFACEVTFYESWADPVFFITASAYNTHDYKDIFVEVITSEGPSPSICRKYEKVS